MRHTSSRCLGDSQIVRRSAFAAQLISCHPLYSCPQVIEAIVEQLRRGEPEHISDATIVTMLTDDGLKNLTVSAATRDACNAHRIEQGNERLATDNQVWLRSSDASIAAAAFDVIESGGDDSGGDAVLYALKQVSRLFEASPTHTWFSCIPTTRSFRSPASSFGWLLRYS